MLPLDRFAFLKIVAGAPLAAMDILACDAAGRVLLGRRANRPAQGSWFVPGGRIYKDERLAQAFRRIALAELGLELELEQAAFVGVYEHFYADNFAGVEGISTHYITLGYRCRVDPHSLRLPAAQHTAYRWWSRAELLASDAVHPNTQAYFRDAEGSAG